jgi:hypothetical protein
MKRNIIISVFCICLLTANGQNLVPNPSFEDTVECPDGFSQIDKAEGWFRWGLGTPDYLNSCSSAFASSVPINALGHQASSGFACKAYAGLFTFTIATNEYLATQLISPLVIGHKYYISFKVSLADTCKFASNNIGALFRVTSFQSVTIPFPYTNFAHINSGTITDKTNWSIIFGSFVADSAYNFIVLGNFFDDNQTDTISITGFTTDAYYYIDDVCVSVDSLTCINFVPSCNTGVLEKEKSKIHVSPNPFTEEITIDFPVSKHSQSVIEIYDMLGKVYPFVIEECTDGIRITPQGLLADGIYFLRVYSKTDSFSCKIIKLSP